MIKALTEIMKSGLVIVWIATAVVVMVLLFEVRAIRFEMKSIKTVVDHALVVDLPDIKATLEAQDVGQTPKPVPKIEINNPSSVYISHDSGKIDLVVETINDKSKGSKKNTERGKKRTKR